MRTTGRPALYGAAIGAALGLLRLSLGDHPLDGGYIPQTDAGAIDKHLGYLVPWADIGALAGDAIGHRRLSGDHPQPAQITDVQPIATTALQRLGHVFGWTGTTIAFPLIAIGLYGISQPSADLIVSSAAISLGIMAFLLGRALRYIFAGSFQ